jgi:Ran GTPase-activating protein (RanGAP) involved in mRNA processing and transport
MNYTLRVLILVLPLFLSYKVKAAAAAAASSAGRGSSVVHDTFRVYLEEFIVAEDSRITWSKLQSLLKKGSTLEGRPYDVRRASGSDFEEYAALETPEEKAVFIRQLNWDKLPEEVQDQWLIILKEGYRRPKEEEGAAGSVEKDLLKTRHSVGDWPYLALRNFSRLTTTQFRDLPLGTLKALSLRDVPRLSIRSLDGIKDHLQVLKLQGIEGDSLVTLLPEERPLLLPQLTTLCLRKAKNLKDIVLKAPKLTHLQIQDVPQLTTLKVAAPQLRSLKIEDAPKLAKMTAFPQLICLTLKNNYFGNEGAVALAESTALTRLTSLDLWGNKIGYKGVMALAESTTLTQLTRLDLACNYIGNEGVTALAESTALTRLTSLDLGGNYIGDEGVTALAESTTLTRLTCLSLENNYIGDEGVTALAESTILTQLIHLRLGNNYIGDVGAKGLAASTTLTQLTSLDLWKNKIGKSAKKALQYAQPTGTWWEETIVLEGKKYVIRPGVEINYEIKVGQTWSRASPVSVPGEGAAAAAASEAEDTFVDKESSIHLRPETKDHLDHVCEPLHKPLVKARFSEEEL